MVAPRGRHVSGGCGTKVNFAILLHLLSDTAADVIMSHREILDHKISGKISMFITSYSSTI